MSSESLTQKQWFSTVDSYLGLTSHTHTSHSKIVYLEAKSNKIKPNP